jgi:hypothetical protein
MVVLPVLERIIDSVFYLVIIEIDFDGWKTKSA